MTKTEWDTLNRKLQFRAFTAAKLGTAEEIEKAKQLLVKAVQTGSNYAETWETVKQALNKNGTLKPGYWETVFRTNTQSAYIAGKLQKYQDTGAKAYQLMVIEDSRTSRICRRLLKESGYGLILPTDHQFWQTYGFPPYHFNCRTSIRPIYGAMIGTPGNNVDNPSMNSFRKSKFKPQTGFGGNPLDSGNWWDLTENQKKLAVKYGLLKEIEKIERDWITGRSVGAMAKKFHVDMEQSVKTDDDDSFVIIKEGTYVTGVKVIAQGANGGKEVKRGIDDIKRLVLQYPLPNGSLTSEKDWYKVRGTAILYNLETKEEKKAEIHWYQCKNIGKIEFKFKRFVK